MDENRANLDKIDDLLESTSEERRFKFNFAKIESVISSQIKEIEDPDPSFETETEKTVLLPDNELQENVIEESADSVVVEEPVIIEEPVVIAEAVNSVVIEEPVNPVVEVEPIAEEKPAPAKEPVQAQQQKMCIIDETSTSVVIEQGPDISVDEIVSGVNVSTAKKAKVKKPKEPLKLKPIQIVIMAIAGLITLWVVMFTIDHTLAANGISPVFSRETETYADGSASYKGLGYKVQFKFDANGNLTQMVCPFWKDGPNDVVEFPGQ